MNDFILTYILLIHFLADFALQTHEQAINKSSSNKWLFYHVGVYSFIWLIATLSMLGINSIIFASITFIAHFCTDYITSRVGKTFWENKDLHNGFVIVGLDQILHYLQLYLTFKLLL